LGNKSLTTFFANLLNNKAILFTEAVSCGIAFQKTYVAKHIVHSQNYINNSSFKHDFHCVPVESASLLRLNYAVLTFCQLLVIRCRAVRCTSDVCAAFTLV